MTAAKLFRYFAYAASTLISLTGFLIVAGFLLPTNIPSTFRVMFGIVLVLYGVYRFVVIHFRRRNHASSFR